MLDHILLDKKLELLSGYIDEMKPLAVDISIDDILADNFKYHTAERLFQLIVDEMVDINIHIIKNENIGAPDDLESTFKLLGLYKVLKSNFADAISPVVGLRNMIVHRYEKLNRKKFIENIKKEYEDFKEYIIQINHFIKNKK